MAVSKLHLTLFLPSQYLFDILQKSLVYEIEREGDRDGETDKTKRNS